MSTESSYPPLHHVQTLSPPTAGPTRSWQSRPHPDPSTPLLATASADKTVHVWSLRDFSLVSTISGGHKRSVRAVDWKDFGTRRRTRPKTGEQKPVVLATGSFDANVGIWIWNDDRRAARFKNALDDGDTGPRTTEAGDSAMTDTDHTTNHTHPTSNNPEANDDDQDEEDEEWHFSTLLTGPDSEIKSIAFSPPHYPTNLLATSSRDKSVWIWEEIEPEEWETIAVLSEHTGDVKSVSWCEGAVKRRSRAARGGNNSTNSVHGSGDVEMGEDSSHGVITQATTQSSEEEEQEDTIIGSREILASGSYDDTIRLWRDVEEEGDWICVAVIDSHKGTVWDVKWEPYINYTALELTDNNATSSSDPNSTITSAFEADWEPRILSCSDDLTIRVFRRELSANEKAKKRDQQQQTMSTSGAPLGFASSRLPSVIRPPSSLETWKQESVLPEVHVRSIYSIDWSRTTGLVVSCGGDGAIVVYKELPTSDDESNAATVATADVDMNGSTPQPQAANDTATDNGSDAISSPYQLRKMQWVVVAMIEAAHDEYEVNHVCWADRRDKDRRFDGEQVIISTGDEGHVRIWALPEHLLSDH
ncbi:hypothetical protein B0A52_08574 [Exophiala mesophila]|uniref:Probable cytosolic iron-sulfur protein assembly protein 1 n=1 Tax=Exophiala mesophila TaxID=212818 RepID=A0A438MTV5_EXOME|nr:hypothetical protein B0A52_08574 [Exophiala mesophila]